VKEPAGQGRLLLSIKGADAVGKWVEESGAIDVSLGNLSPRLKVRKRGASAHPHTRVLLSYPVSEICDADVIYAVERGVAVGARISRLACRRRCAVGSARMFSEVGKAPPLPPAHTHTSVRRRTATSPKKGERLFLAGESEKI
jgi:hypothetical protein